ncbi:MAG: polysaccharide biosynthesis/export family protein, partial [Phycisphaerae bacterium]|nr:polysaccharide biosynthesis/export family protein [Phycisphaerae bacterium]
MMAAVTVHAGDAVPSSLVSQLEPGYRLGAEDVLLVSVWKDEQLTREVVVRPDGMFSFPLVGDIQAENQTVEDIRG